MADAAVQKIPKPQLRGLLSSGLKGHAIRVALLATVSCTLFKIFVVDDKKKRYAEYYKNYDPEAEYERMRKLGLFQSADP